MKTIADRLLACVSEDYKDLSISERRKVYREKLAKEDAKKCKGNKCKNAKCDEDKEDPHKLVDIDRKTIMKMIGDLSDPDAKKVYDFIRNFEKKSVKK